MVHNRPLVNVFHKEVKKEGGTERNKRKEGGGGKGGERGGRRRDRREGRWRERRERERKEGIDYYPYNSGLNIVKYLLSRSGLVLGNEIEQRMELVRGLRRLWNL